jgi:hypothetical protein
MIVSRTHRTVAASIALAYVAVQGFQWYVFGALPESGTPMEALLQGAHPLNIARAVSMLLSFFGLIYLFGVSCALAYPRRPLVALAAFVGFFVFFLLEICLRAIELFHVYLALPGHYQAAADATAQAAVLAQADTFASIQHALYFPLGLNWLLGSVLLCVALGQYRIDRLAQFAFGLNALRLALRMADDYVFPPVSFDALYGALYLPLVVLTFVPIAIWLWRRPEA